MFRNRVRRRIRKRRGLAQDTGTDPFEDLSGPWDGLDEMAESFTWATSPVTPTSGVA